MIALVMSGSVGTRGRNNGLDVLMIKSLLNAYARRNKLTELAMNETVDDACLTLIAVFQTKVVKMAKPDSLVSANAGTFKQMVAYLKAGFSVAAITKPTEGALTWDAEGNEGGYYHSRVFHVPSASSGLTIGRGYDMRDKTTATIVSDLTTAGIDTVKANLIGKAATKKGKTAEQFVYSNDLLDFEITAPQQLSLFKKTYQFMLDDVKRISAGASQVKHYGTVDWDKTPQTVIDLLVDLRYRGDYTPATRRLIQKFVADGEYVKFKDVIQDQSNWSGVPGDRFTRRSNFADAIKDKDGKK
ncbi:hypothetical protein [Gallaecimonas pentaromativorans]|uniref:Pesticin C-terminal domain-containing protein n=1 Tax=Gallaecimonas pentaromativorans TaxID=584787 RepID=A0A3N1NJH0_9GAMM|nr:hypothetical protein [Gallaecimonas pentaromativorans]MED5524960.1 hypothetical protein [Pseudomonadota bacterium]ROQ18862.1 hypothetical protein EDC28_11415 [Gallaecimonas pentaromativorans]